MGPYVTGTRYGFSSPLEGEVAAQRSEGGAAAGYRHQRFCRVGLRPIHPLLTSPLKGGGKPK